MNKKYIRKKRILRKIYGTVKRPRLTVFRSNKHFYAQLIDDLNHKTLLAISTVKQKNINLNCEITNKLGLDFGNHLAKNQIEKIVFDKNKRPYHGKIKSFADAIREKGIDF